MLFEVVVWQVLGVVGEELVGLGQGVLGALDHLGIELHFVLLH